MSWTNFHTHCNFCDGEGDPQEYVDVAIKQEVKALGFTSHAPLPFTTDWAMKAEDLKRYCQTIRSIQKKNAGKLQIFIGLEIDYIPEVIGPGDSTFQPLSLDYTLGSVHFVGYDRSLKPWEINDTKEVFDKGLEEIYDGDIKRVVESYYSLICEMVRTQSPDVIGHLDLIKKNIINEEDFSENEQWYKKAVFDTLQTISESQTIVEVNTGAIRELGMDSLNPNIWILERCLELKIPITLNSDAHDPKEITAGFEEAAPVLKGIGFKELMVLGSNGWYTRAFTAEGFE